MTHLGTQNISYSQKKGRESNWQFDSRSLKVRNSPNLLVCTWRAAYYWKGFNEAYCFTLHLNRRFAQKILGLQNHKSPNFEKI
jgi:hypothetical protein